MSEETRQFFLEICKDDIEEARQKAMYEREIEIAKRMIGKDKFTFEEIADITDLPLQTILDLAKEKDTKGTPECS